MKVTLTVDEDLFFTVENYTVGGYRLTRNTRVKEGKTKGLFNKSSLYYPNLNVLMFRLLEMELKGENFQEVLDNLNTFANKISKQLDKIINK